MRRYLAIVRLLGLVGVASLAAQPARANLLLNPSFESGAFVNQGNQTMSLRRQVPRSHEL